MLNYWGGKSKGKFGGKDQRGLCTTLCIWAFKLGTVLNQFVATDRDTSVASRPDMLATIQHPHQQLDSDTRSRRRSTAHLLACRVRRVRSNTGPSQRCAF